MNSLTPVSQFVDASAPERRDGLRAGHAPDALRRLAAERPAAPALLHKRRGRWHVFSWALIDREVARLAAVLRARARGAEVRLAVSGAYEPDLLILALAALSTGGEVLTVPPGLRGEELARELASVRPSHAFVQGRRTLSRWLAAPPPGDAQLPLFSNQAFIGSSRHWDVQPYQDPAAALATRPLWGAARGRLPVEIAWADEGTEWRDGLEHLLERWLAGGLVLAFPETAESAARDRRDIQPSSFIQSAARQHRLAEENDARLAPQGTWTRRLADHAQAAPGGLLARLVNRRRNAVLGLGRVQAHPSGDVEPSVSPTPVSA